MAETNDIQAFVSHQTSLLELELRSEQGEETEASSSAAGKAGKGSEAAVVEERPQNVLRGLEVDSITVGLYGRTVVHLSSRGRGDSLSGDHRRSADQQQQQRDGDNGGGSTGASSNNTGGRGGDQQPSPLLPAHRLTVGDEIEILSKKGGRKQQDAANTSSRSRNPGGVICGLTETTISIALFAAGGSRRSGGGNNNYSNGKNKKKEKKSNDNDNKNDEDYDDDEYGLGQPPLTVLPRSSAAVHRKMVDALEELGKSGLGHEVAGQVIKTVFSPDIVGGMKTYNTNSINTKQDERHVATATYNFDLDSSQQEAIDFALGTSSSTGSSSSNNGGGGDGRPLALIHGPPGTGKTTTVVELIQRAVYEKGWKVLVTAPSNVAVDNVLEKLVAGNSSTCSQGASSRRSRKKNATSDSSGTAATATAAKPPRKLRAVRLGHPARIKQSIQPYSLESLVQCADGTEVVNDVRAELGSYIKILSNDKSRYSDRRVARREVKVLRSELRRREEAVVSDLIVNADVVLATNVGAASSALNTCLDKKKGGFDLVVIDEAAQALEASCWIPILRGQRLVLAGDHRQLPPTIKCNDGRVQRELGRTMFERVMQLYGDDKLTVNSKGRGQISRMLRTQYRMNQDIADWASQATYGGQLINHETVRAHKLSDLSHVTLSANDMDFSPLLLIDTVGCDMLESENSFGSRYNEGEARLVASHVQALIMVGVDPKEIAVISPYNGQVELLRSLLLPAVPSLEIRSVDGFQGGEREAVILSLVRSSERGGAAGGIGFLQDTRRLNVAITRARRHCCVICDTETVSRSPFIKGLVGWMEDRGEYRSAAEYVANDTVVGGSSGQKSSNHPPTPSKPAQRDEKEKPSSSKVAPVPSTSQAKGPKKATTKKMDSEEKRRKKIMDKIGSFADKAKKGEEMTVGTNMSKFDELVACELAQQLGLENRVEGPEGINRRVIIRQIKETDLVIDDDAEEAHTESAFAALVIDDDSDSDKSDEEQVASSSGGANNSLLADLAKERMERQKQQEHQSTPSASKGKSKKKKKKKKPASGPPAVAAETNQEDGYDEDMAFLDAQIERVQTSHGRKVEGRGKAYKSIINGVLLAKPEAKEPKRDARASNALKQKLKKAGEDRKTKAKGKKKK